MDAIDKIIGLLDERGLDQGELESEVRLPQGRVTRWKKGTGKIGLEQGLAIARLLKVPLEWLADPEAVGRPEEWRGLTTEQRYVLNALDYLGFEEVSRRLMTKPPGATAAGGASPPGKPDELHVTLDGTTIPEPNGSRKPGGKRSRRSS